MQASLRTVSYTHLSEIAKEKHGSMYVNEDLIDLIWTDRPPMSKAPVMIFDNKYTGEDISSKLKRVREQMAQKGAKMCIRDRIQAD